MTLLDEPGIVKPLFRSAAAGKADPVNVALEDHDFSVRADDDPHPEAVGLVAHLDLHAREGQVFAAAVAGNPQGFVVRVDPTDPHSGQKVWRCLEQEIHGDCLRVLAGRQRAADQIQVDPGKALEASVVGDDGAEMLAAEGGIASVAARVADEFGGFTIDDGGAAAAPRGNRRA